VAGVDVKARCIGWEPFWDGLWCLADLGRREVQILADTARMGIYENFERESSPDGEKWPGLAPWTQRIRASGMDERGVAFRTGARHPILRRTGDLMQSFINPFHPRNITRVNQSEVVTSIELGAEDDPKTPGRIALLNDGGVSDTGHIIPQREFIGFSSVSMERVDNQARQIIHQRVDRL